MVEKEEVKGFIKDTQIRINSVELKESTQEKGIIEKVIFNTENQRITWKPKIEKKELVQGFKVIKKVPCEILELPKIITEINQECNNKGFAIVKLSYNYWETEQDGRPVTYKFLTSAKTLESWKLIKEVAAGETGQ